MARAGNFFNQAVNAPRQFAAHGFDSFGRLGNIIREEGKKRLHHGIAPLGGRFGDRYQHPPGGNHVRFDVPSKFGVAFEKCTIKAKTVSCASSGATVLVFIGSAGCADGLDFGGWRNFPRKDVITTASAFQEAA